MAHPPTDDVIRIRLDTNEAITAFRRLLAEQAQEGETREPANPAAIAVWRDLAPFRLVEYAYVDEAVGPIEGAYIGFPDGGLYAVEEDIPDQVVNDLVAASGTDAADLPPIYIYVLLGRRIGPDAIDSFLSRLSDQVGHPLVGVFQLPDGGFAAREHDGPQSHESVIGNERPLDRPALLEGIAARFRGSDGRAYAALTLSFSRHLLEFSSEAERDGFVLWSRALCDWIFANGGESDALGFAGACRPAEAAPPPDPGQNVVKVALGPLHPNAPTGETRATWAALCQAILDSSGSPR